LSFFLIKFHPQGEPEASIAALLRVRSSTLRLHP